MPASHFTHGVLMRRCLPFLMLRMLCLPVVVAGQSPLPLGTPASDVVTSAEPSKFEYNATAAGVLTVVVTAKEDVSLAFTDRDGAPLPYGHADGDLGGNMGTEILSVPINAPGLYIVEVRTYSDQAVTFKINANFMVEAAFAQPVDIDSRPGAAELLGVGMALVDSLNPEAGDQTDWYSFLATETATIVISTRVEANATGDITLEAYLGDDFTQWIAIADQDLRMTPGNESLVLDVVAGELIRIKLSSLGGMGPLLKYRISVAKLP